MQNTTNRQQFLESLHTKQLLKHLSAARIAGRINPDYDHLGDNRQNPYVIGYNGHIEQSDIDNNKMFDFSINELKTVLANREHIPNKKERKLLRSKKEGEE